MFFSQFFLQNPFRMVELHNESSDDSFGGRDGIWECTDSEPEQESPPPAKSQKNLNSQGSSGQSSSSRPSRFPLQPPKNLVKGIEGIKSPRPPRVAASRRPWSPSSSDSSSKEKKKRGKPTRKPRSEVSRKKATSQRRNVSGRFARRGSADSGVVADAPSASNNSANVAQAPAPTVNNAVKLEPVDNGFEPGAGAGALQAVHGEAAPVIINSRLLNSQLHGVIISNSRIESCEIIGSQIFGPLMNP